MEGMKNYINGQIKLIDTIEECVKEKWPEFDDKKVHKISLAIYQGWSLTDINSTLEAIEMDLDRK
ncbi:TPA: hypothetical protein ACKQ4H_001838 [Streptococcus pyogenes]|uniref:hypothetical protein n=1 Tax=Streptococcus pyogenes TaxID=1314 RepID=UPI0007C369AB|nr:hypothetical protein [Streptococcus pyogenes]QBX28938.1 hypothetical protein Javan474_0048 [Streptococcus phage Javan474]HER4545951.1 hypothetical protein [Streptococcus pyogenes NGAS726]MCF1202166.1 hypothetical protein [Streptococcus pyogenes]OAC68097.1 hypothetical protein AWU07_02285 [Streptococcus pyogenes]OAC79138.1 hypothetical protein AWT94_05160 [Streptococcus pyogenes]